MSDPLGLFDEGAGNDPLGLFSEEKKGAVQSPGLLDFLMGAPRKGYEQSKASRNALPIAQTSAGLLEAGANLGTGMAAQAMVIPRLINNMRDPNYDPSKHEAGTVDDSFRQVMEDYTYQPRTDSGQNISEHIGDFMNQVGIPAGAVLHTLPPIRTAPSIRSFARGMEETKIPGKAPKADPLDLFSGEDTWMQKQMEQGAARDAAEQTFADKNNIQGELDLRPKQMPVDENGMPVDMARSLDAQDATMPEQPDLFNEEHRAAGEQQRAAQLADVQAREEALKAQYEQMSTQHPDKAAEIEDAYRQRQQSLFDEKQQVTDDIKNDALTKLEEDLRSGAYTPQGDGQGPKTRAFNRGMGRRQGGAIDVQGITEGLQQLKEGLISASDYLDRFKGTFSPKELENAKSVMDDPTHPQKIVFMSPEDFHNIAEKRGADFKSSMGRRESIRDGLKSPHGLDDIPYLKGVVKDGEFKVTSHNGRHRMDVFREQGIDAVPVRVAATDVQALMEGHKSDAVLPDTIQTQNNTTTSFSGMSRGQRGAIDFEGIQKGLRRLFPIEHADVPAINKIVGKNTIPVDPKASDIVAKALAEKQDTNSFRSTRNIESGGTLAAMSRRSALVDGISKIVQNAQKRADLYIKETIFPVEKHFRDMTRTEIKQLADVFKDEMMGKAALTAEQMEGRGLSQRQMEAYAAMRQLHENARQITNTQRKALGLKEIDSREYYSSSRWQGDFRQPVYRKTSTGGTQLAWYLAADSERGLSTQAKALLKAHPDLIIDPKQSHVVRSNSSKSDLQTMYTSMLDILGRDDPAVAKIKQAYEDSLATETSNTLGQLKHAESKANIRGFVGDRPGKNPKNEALEMFQQQIQYAKNAYKWASMQEAGGALKEVLGNEQLRNQQPKNIEYAQEYYRNALGHGQAKWVNALEDAFRSTGVSPHILDAAVGTMKSLFITQKLALSAGYTIANLMQVVNTIPHMVDIMMEHGGNPGKAFGTGLFSGPMMASGHYINSLGGNFSKYLGNVPFLERAFKYAEDNGITSRSIYDENPITSRGPVAGGMTALGKTMTIPETFVRSAAYMSFVHMLKDTGKYTDEGKLFQRAEELTNASMVDYRAPERPLGFSKLGTIGNALNTLQTFPMNLYNQYRYFGKEAMKGNVAPLLSLIAVQYAMAGAIGLPGFQDIDKIFGWMKGKLPDSTYAKVKDFDPKLWMIEHLGEASVYGAVSTSTDISMTSRLSAPGALDMIQAPGGPITDFAKQAGSVANMVTSPNKTTIAQGVHDVAPTGLQGYLETGPFKDQNSVPRQDGTTLYKKSTDLQARKGLYARTPEEETLRSFGLRSQREVLSNDVTYKTGQMEQQVTERSKSLVDKYYDAIRRGDMDQVKSIQTLYTKLNGSAIQDSAIENQIQDEFTTTLEKKSSSTQQKLEAIKGIARMKKIMEAHDNK